MEITQTKSFYKTHTEVLTLLSKHIAKEKLAIQQQAIQIIIWSIKTMFNEWTCQFLRENNKSCTAINNLITFWLKLIIIKQVQR